MEEIIKELLQRNAELTKMVVDLSRELAGMNVPVTYAPVEMEQLYLNEEDEDAEYRAAHDPLHGVDQTEVSELLALTGFPNTAIEVD
jgi:hypothetical protein